MKIAGFLKRKGLIQGNFIATICSAVLEHFEFYPKEENLYQAVALLQQGGFVVKRNDANAN